MDDYIRLTEELFSAARSEFKHLEHYYFHNCPYERVWRENRRRFEATTPTLDMMRTYGPDWSLILVGDATMSPYEITQPGGSVEHWNDEAGNVWLERMTGHYRRSAWLNPTPEASWHYTQSIGIVRQLMENRMYPLTLGGLETMTKELSR
jgi:uncharacterized protein with von Willebrand factor type A (vWA) domain